jgi:alpha-glucuronidase
MRLLTCIILLCISSLSARADDGYRLWLKYDAITDKTQKSYYSSRLKTIYANTQDASVKVAVEELQIAVKGLLGFTPIVKPLSTASNGLILKTDKNTPDINEEGFRISSSGKSITIQGKKGAGVLYGVFHLLRNIQTGEDINTVSSPDIQLRLLNHWDNHNGTIERGYAGMSLWKWYELPERIDPRYIDYARANASIGINGTVLNNVNASARFLTSEYLGKVKALADAFRPYGIKVYLSVNFATPRILKETKDADPLNPEVQKWWADKTKEIYKLIPDFGGYLVKANSEGEPGPMDYGRTHVDGANMLADAVKPHGGIIMWRAFVYSFDPKYDRFKAAYNEFKPFDGKFADNVIIQVKNGPIDFMPREPISPLFTTMEKTPVSMEFQLTQEYLGWATHMVYLAPMFKECLDTDTHAKGEGSTVANVLKGKVFGYKHTAIAGVANTGSDRNWTGHPITQSNWYTLGRLAWNTDISSEKIADEWIKQTLTRNTGAVETIAKSMLKSRDVYVNYTAPFGLHHVMGESHHFGPEPWVEKAPRPDWTAPYYHRADEKGIGFDRTKTGSDGLSQYPEKLAKVYENEDTCPEEFLLWFHHVSWDKKLKSGKPLWESFVRSFYNGADQVKDMQAEWQSVKGDVPKETFLNVEARLKTQYKEAIWWRDACVLYFQQFSKMPIPSDLKTPERTLEEVKKLVDVYHIK